MMSGAIIVLVFLVTFGLFLSEAESVDEIEPITYDDDYIIDKFVGGLERPIAMTFVGDDILVIEKDTGKVFLIEYNGIFHNQPVLDVPVESAYDSGLLGISSISNHVFLYFTESESGFDNSEIQNIPLKNKVYRYDWNGENLINPILIKELPGENWSNLHNGGVMTKGLNNEIYFAIGDLFHHGIFQNVISSNNVVETGIFKIDTEENNKVELFAMGIRNSFGLAVDPQSGYLWDTENGPDNFDEINLVEPGFNSGWEIVMGPIDRNYLKTDSSQVISQPFENFVYSDPEFSWYEPIAATAIEFPNNHIFGK